ncbi:MAG: DUF2330 domain-containing protein [Deltaproteobacteria bacterium]|nr:DUF2330 domain-containing protein [Deltaproteobacteria bacterium]
MNRIVALFVAVFLLVSTREARAFCGFYVSGSDGPLVNDATQVVLMRDGVRTVLSMQNNYQGPPADFAMVVPVPVVLSKETVKTLPREVFDKVDKLDAPRLVEYWEQDPCSPVEDDEFMVMKSSPGALESVEDSAGSKKDYGVKIEAKFSVAEYDIVILSAKDSGGLDAWLRDEKYKIPAGSEPFLRPYVQRGSKFFVAKVDAKKVKFAGNGTMLSPLRFHYDSQEFSLPIRLGLVNARGAQDLIVHVLAKGQRYEVANYPNVAVPTNLEVSDATRQQFPAFYAALFDRVLEKNPKAIVTEYAWQAGSCDPCPIPPLDVDALAVLGADVLPGVGDREDRYSLAGSFVLTRLHARYTKESLGADLVFRAAPPVVGGREHVVSEGKLERGAVTSSENNFQARYIIRHRWEGPIACANPVRNVWGGPPGAGGRRGRNTNMELPKAAQGLAFAPRGKVQLATFIREDSAELDVKATPPAAGDPPLGVVVPPATHTCGCTLTPTRATASLLALLVPFAALVLRRRHR